MTQAVVERPTAVPEPGRPRALRAPKVAEERLRNGLRVLIVRKPSVPKVEMQLLVPLGKRSPSAAPERLLGKTLTSGTSGRASVDITRHLQRLGGWLVAGVGPDRLVVQGGVLAPNLRSHLDLLGEILTDAAFPAEEHELERGRIVQEIQIARSQPQFVVVEALRKRLFGRHPYGVVQPKAAAVAKLPRASVRRLFAERVQPRDAVLVMVGDVRPQSALAWVTEALGRWRGRRAVPPLADPEPIAPGPTRIVDRPASVQTNIRLAGPALPPGHPDSYALQVANTIFGGAFSSRLVQNIREDKGYTYSPGSQLEHLQRASLFHVGADVGTEVTAPSLVEIRYELGRMSSMPVTADELHSAKRYLTGVQAIRIQSQRGLAAQLALLAAFGLGVDHLREYPARVAGVTADDVRAAAARHLAPTRLVSVLVGDAARIAGEVEVLEPTEVVASGEFGP